MFDVNQITTTLRGLPDRMLQQYAMMNKGNPYVLSLAVAESNQRKQLRTAAQARMAMPRPKVADAAIAGMSETPAVDAMGNVTGMAAGGLPEDYGIGRLPARNIERMADGGIAGYGDGDDVPRKNGMAQGGMYDFAQRSEPVVRMAGGGVPGYAGGVFNSASFKAFLKTKNIDEKAFTSLDFSEKEKVLNEFKKETAGPQKPAPAPKAATPTAAAPAAPTKEGALYKPAKLAGQATKATTSALKGVPYVSGALGAYQGISDLKGAGGFYDDPNVPTLEKAKQAGLTTLKAGLPIAGTAVGSFFSPAGTFLGGAAGTAASEFLDLETDALKAWKKANPQATPEQTKQAATKLAYDGPKLNAAQAERAVTGQPTITPVPEAKEPADTGAGGAGGQGGVGGGGGPGTSAQSIKDMYALFAGKPDERQTKRDAIRGQLGQLAGAETLQAQNMYKQLQDDIAARGEYGKDRETKLKGKEARIAKEEGQSGGLALLEAGLAMMAGTSPNAFANIGQGAMAGTAAYRKSMEKITDARDKLDDAYGRLEDVRFNQKSMDTKELREAKAGIDKAANAGLRSLVQFAGQELDMDAKEATTMFGGAINLQQANIAAGPGYQRNAMMAKRFAGDDKKMAEFTKVQKQVMADLKNDTNYATAPSEAAKNKIYQDRLRSALMTNPFLSAYALNLGFENEPTGTVRNAGDE
jgi:hypothetical protein